MTNRGKYRLKAVLHLAAQAPGTSLGGQEIADANSIPKKFLDAILLDLRHAGMLRSREGSGGGYTLARSISDIRVGHIIRVLDGPLAPIGCASKSAYVPCQDCRDVGSCAVRITMTKVQDAMSDILHRMWRKDMMTYAENADIDLMYRI
nr:Rrf2 family transcriptional regulator [Ancylobacter koreensis]